MRGPGFRRRGAVLTLTVVACVVPASLAAVAPPAGAAAATAEGTTALTLTGPAGRRLNAAGVRLDAAAPGAAFGPRVALPVKDGRVGTTGLALGHSGDIVLRLPRRAGRPARSITLREVEVQLGSGVWVTARIGGRRRAFLRSARGVRPTVDRRNGRARLTGGRVVLALPAAVAIRRALGLRAVGLGSLGTLTIDATIAPDTSPDRAPERPPGAVDVTAATLDWHVRDSFIRYIAAGEGTSVDDGARATGRSVRPGTSEPLDYDYALPFTDGWFDPASGLAVLRFRGGVRFRYTAHGIDLRTGESELELAADGQRSRATFAISGSGATDYSGSRDTLIDLAPSLAASSTTSADGRTRTLTAIPGSVPAAGASVFGGFYAPGDPFGWMSVTFTTGSA